MALLAAGFVFLKVSRLDCGTALVFLRRSRLCGFDVLAYSTRDPGGIRSAHSAGRNDKGKARENILHLNELNSMRATP